MSRKPLSVVLCVKNEAHRIRQCLDAIKGWADEIVVVDDASTDETKRICLEYGAVIFDHVMDIEGSHRNWSYAQATHDWVFSLDADEIFTEELKAEVDVLLEGEQQYAVYAIPRKNMLGDYWLRWGGQYPSAQNKLFLKDKFKWEEKADVHPRAFYEGKAGLLTSHLIHYTYRDIADFLRKVNNQTTLEARKWYRIFEDDPKKAKAKMNFLHACWRVLDRFFRAYVRKQGYKDGFYGFVSAYFGGVYQMVSYIKYREMFKNNAS